MVDPKAFATIVTRPASVADTRPFGAPLRASKPGRHTVYPEFGSFRKDRRSRPVALS
jgi:hypothetical protein